MEVRYTRPFGGLKALTVSLRISWETPSRGISVGRLASPTEESSLSLGFGLKPWTIEKPRLGGVQKKNRSVCVFLDIHPFPQKDAIYPMANQQGQPDAARALTGPNRGVETILGQGEP